jgi:hypothetical protein
MKQETGSAGFMQIVNSIYNLHSKMRLLLTIKQLPERQTNEP